jgi:hypothetical protein
MDLDIPSSRPPVGLRGNSLRAALGGLGHTGEASQVYPVDRTTLPPSFPAVFEDTPAAADEDDDEAPAALRPDQLARWFERRS